MELETISGNSEFHVISDLQIFVDMYLVAHSESFSGHGMSQKNPTITV